jgi:DNA-binding Xre family transcriptional regulator
MDKNIKKFMETTTISKAQILDKYYVEVQTKDGEIFKIISDISKFESDEYKAYILHLIEFIFDRNFSEDKEKMIERISWEFLRNGVPSMGLDCGSRQSERVRIGQRIRELRVNKKMEGRDLALLAGIDAANLSRIEQGKYSTGIDILSRIAIVLDAHLDLVPNS